MTVALVGAGPGDPGLLTLRGADLLRTCEVVVFDRLANPVLLELVPASAERISVGKAPGAVEMNQDQINAVLVEHGRAGRRVVRLKGGDPFVFGRGGEEAEALAAAGVPFEVVPGITSAIAAAAYAGIPVTHRGVSTHFTVVTGHEDPAKGTTDVDWEALGRIGGTLVILMGVGNLSVVARRLMDAGRSPETPVAAVRNGTRCDQHTVRATLATIADAGVRSPSAIIVGEVAALDLAWFEQRPLFGRTIVVTRAREQQSSVSAKLGALGAQVIEAPAIALEPVGFELPELNGLSWLVFTSVNGVTAFFERGLRMAGLDSRALAGTRVAAIGPGTAGALLSYGVRADLVPERFVAESLLEVFPVPQRQGERVVLARAEQARDVLPEGLRAAGYDVAVVPVYRTVSAKPDLAVVERVRNGDVDAITFTSSSTVVNFCEIFGNPSTTRQAGTRPKVVSIGPVTSATAAEHGVHVDAEASVHTIDGLVAELMSVLGSS